MDAAQHNHEEKRGWKEKQEAGGRKKSQAGVSSCSCLSLESYLKLRLYKEMNTHSDVTH